MGQVVINLRMLDRISFHFISVNFMHSVMLMIFTHMRKSLFDTIMINRAFAPLENIVINKAFSPKEQMLYLSQWFKTTQFYFPISLVNATFLHIYKRGSFLKIASKVTG